MWKKVKLEEEAVGVVEEVDLVVLEDLQAVEDGPEEDPQ